MNAHQRRKFTRAAPKIGDQVRISRRVFVEGKDWVHATQVGVIAARWSMHTRLIKVGAFDFVRTLRELARLNP